MFKNDSTEKLGAQVSHAFHARKPLRITAGNSKSFYGRKVDGEEISVAGHSGIIEYRASELVLTARSGTRLSEIEDALAENQQMLAYEPPIHDRHSTLGGSVACGLSGPRRPYAGAARDFVLGTTIINGKGERLKFGGQVMKNVAGYDASRLMTGAQGTLGVLLDISIKVLPRPGREITLCFEQDFEQAHSNLRQWILQGHPITASCYIDDQLFVRLSSTVNGAKSAHATIGGDLHSNDLWDSLRHQTHDFFQQHQNLWRVSVAPSADAIASGQPQLTEWHGALRWIASDEELFTAAKDAGGHASRYRLFGAAADHIFQPLSAPMLALHQRLKKSFDPENILNPGRLYPGL
jgi:glycolate oxidase FAD binding subunit